MKTEHMTHTNMLKINYHENRTHDTYEYPKYNYHENKTHDTYEHAKYDYHENRTHTKIVIFSMFVGVCSLFMVVIFQDSEICWIE